MVESGVLSSILNGRVFLELLKVFAVLVGVHERPV